MTETTERVFSAVERRCTFFLPVQGADDDYRLIRGRIWRHKGLLRDEDDYGPSQLKSEIASNIIGQLFGFTRGSCFEDTCLLESCDGPEWSFTVDLDACPYTRRSLEAACQLLSDMLNNREDFYADKPHSHNRSGNVNYPDWAQVFHDFDVPGPVRWLLKQRKRR